MLRALRRSLPSAARSYLRAFSSDPGRHQTPIVDALWKKREKARAERPSPPPSDSSERKLTPKRPCESTNSVVYAFSQPEFAELRDTYSSPWGHVRPGRLLEDLDALAGTIAFDHCRSEGEADLLLVTASVDRIVYRQRPNLHDDIRLEGAVSWVGRSSMEISMSAISGSADSPFLLALFTFVARNPLTNKSATINPLILPPGDVGEPLIVAHDR